MKIKVKNKSYEQVMAMPRPKHKKPLKQLLIFRWILWILSVIPVLRCRVTYNKIGMEKLGKEPCMILMNHSSFIDLKIASVLFVNRPFNVVCTSDGFVGMEWIMRLIGCIPTQKFVTDMALVKDIKYTIDKNKCSVLMYPEASYSFDGTATPLPDSVGKLLKLLKVPVVTVITHGAFGHDPLYNGLQQRKVKVSADVKYLLSPEQVEAMSVDQINEVLKQEFGFDNFRWQQENNVKIDEPFRADGLDRVLYKCPHCNAEGATVGKGTTLKCTSCGEEYILNEYGKLVNDNGIFDHIPSWYAWERECVRNEIEAGEYIMETDVDICMIVDFKAVYRVGSGHLVHNADGFHLTGCDGKLDYKQSVKSSYGLYADYYWYEIGDMICIGNKDCLYYCFPKGKSIVAKARLAAEEMYNLNKSKHGKKKETVAQ